MSQFSFLSILFYYFRKIPFSHSISLLFFHFYFFLRIYRWSTYNFSLFISISLIASLISFFFGAGYARRNVFALFILATGLTKRFCLTTKLKNGIYSTYMCYLFCIWTENLSFIARESSRTEKYNCQLFIRATINLIWFSKLGIEESFSPLINQLSKWS